MQNWDSSSFGGAGGWPCAAAPRAVPRRSTYSGCSSATSTSSVARWGTQPDLETLVDLTADGTLDPIIGDEYTLDETGQAFADMQSRDAFGKLVIRP
nr:zinc-binding dehydrogenase [Halococcus sp. PRR34]